MVAELEERIGTLRAEHRKAVRGLEDELAAALSQLAAKDQAMSDQASKATAAEVGR